MPKISFSQYGEDLIVRSIFYKLAIKTPSYLDIGAYHPYLLNNTMIFYENGSRGINIEPNPNGLLLFNQYRSEDTNLNVGIGKAEGKFTYFRFEDSTLNTFSEEEADRMSQMGKRIIDQNEIKVKTIDQIIDAYHKGIYPDFLSVDVEGQELEIINSMQGELRELPKVVCLESYEYHPQGKGAFRQELIQSLEKVGYIHFANTGLNSICINKTVW